ncbi:alpha/beta hydrolase [Rheinheimera sp. 1928-s]|uniref:alpha/beta fold hydrolase n=1 Tax=Rheinheimera sp. 1928-s TaxID=3033803 RepID=UPI00261E3429|nr:alpha/beta hydrolase [Rheinheimera sp. 1928-s]MDF3124341.1 alpha/beta hydrolase [Rheinheimera sp. 1928-s]
MSALVFSLPALSLAGWQQGLASARVTLCLHGWLDNADSFLPLSVYLPQLNLVAIDLPGHGQSQHRSSDAHYHFLDWIYDVATLIKTQGWQQVDIIGHSMGGMIGSVLAAVMPQMVRKLVLIDSIGLVTGEACNTTQQVRTAISHRWQSPNKQKPVYSDLQSAALARQKQSDFDINCALILAKRGTELCAGGLTWSADMRLRESSAYRLMQSQAMQLLNDIQCPVLAVLAKDGLEMMQKAKQEYQAHYRQLELVEIQGGHHCHMMQPKITADAIRQFLLS